MQILLQPISSLVIHPLVIHPLLELVPLPGEDDPVYRDMAQSVCERGIRDPIKVNKGRVVDGRKRLRAAKAAALTEVPTIEISDEDAALEVIDSLLARWHATKSAQIYVTFPLCEDGLAESRKRRVDYLKSGTEKRVPKNGHVRSYHTAQELAESRGIERNLFFEARAVRKKFAEYPELRARWEPEILIGRMSLGAVLQAMAGKLAAMDGKTHPKNDPEQLTLALFEMAEPRFSRWEQLTPAQKEKAAQEYEENWLKHLPDDLVRRTKKWLRENKDRGR